MKIYVLLKRTFDTEERIVIENGQIKDGDAEFIINPYDEYAIEEAVQLRDSHGGEVTVVTVGNEDGEKELRTALAMDCDKAVLIDTEGIEASDQYTTTTILAKFFEDKEFDLILAGNVAIDNGTGQVGPRLAELLNIPHVATVTDIKIDGKKISLVRDSEGDEEKIETTLPLLITTQQGLNNPRYPSLPGIMKAKKKPLEILELDDLDIEEDDVLAKTVTINRYLPLKKEAGMILQGEMDDQINELVNLLRNEAKVV